MVIGPTPPGTGVMAPATLTASAKSTSPTSLPLPSGFTMRLMPTSMTMAPGLIQSPLHDLRLADGGDDEIGAAHDSGQILGARMRDGHRAVLAQQQLRHRLADDVGAADDDGVEARQVVLHRLREDDRADGRARRQRALADRQAARRSSGGSRRRPSPGRSAPAPCWQSMCLGSGICTRMPLTFGSALSLATRSSTHLLGRVLGQLVLERLHAAPRRSAPPCCARRPCSPDPRRRAPRRGRAQSRARDLSIATSAATSERTLAAMALPSMT